ncbi:MAG: Translation initiation factor IF-2 [Candidatus Roizmanbacteria bacterium GW2011_GWA2_37_7]|uniref:Translation initiation factor IF-2 n=1 Tax=Candidatus Roizmanbacteria bacterium GW2011_GWA2_37_7 TaxID=1618481 RepID=A0A0G0JNL7_9BACT|nr:MAG: Translation initiation factor IF-2 [Candidatus Roizmanbacteria bacterium GW2011_GWA2_37_7]
MKRSPIVTILGHVDHGKTTLLDTIRKSRLASKEHGGITQRIGGYEIKTEIKGYDLDKITFIDTPGHEAFSKLRLRGANVADIAILVIDASDSVMPQTIESIAHIKSAKIPFIVALNKMDLPGANPKKVKKDLLKHEVITEDMGGSVVCIPISATKGEGVQELLESILIIASDIDLSFDLKNPSKSYIIETNKDQRGLVVSAIIKDGTLRVGDTLYTHQEKIKVRALINDQGKSVREITPSTPFEILGFSKLPEVGTLLTSDPQIAAAPEVIEQQSQSQMDVSSLLKQEGEVKQKKLTVIIKADSQGSLEAIIAAILPNENVEVVLSNIGGIHRSDIFLAKITKSIIIGFSVSVDTEVKQLANQEKVIIKTYNIIYELLDELEEVSALIQEKEEREKNLKAQAKILATFVIEGETVFGGMVTKGKVNLADHAEVYRKNNLIGKSQLSSLKIRAKVTKEVKKDQECGMQFNPPLDIRVGDVIKFIL